MGLYRNDLEVSLAEAAGGKSASQWVVIGRDAQALAMLNGDKRWKPLAASPSQRVWTDDFSNILSVFRWH
jgi:hypothetical protein